MKEKHYLIAYDMANNRRRNKIVKVLSNYAYRVQYSVFEFSTTDLIFEKIKNKIQRIIDNEEDSILIYELCETDWNKKMSFGINKSEENIYEASYAII